MIRFSELNNVTVMSGVGDEELRELYQTSTALLMPLLDATANNALLEAMACGLPVVTTDLAGTRDYLDDSCASFVPKSDDQGYVDAAIRLSSEPELRRRMSEASLTRALDFNWSRVAERLVKLYRSLW
jgi:glycosyltransferase involved in cell wall biosynthesis